MNNNNKYLKKILRIINSRLIKIYGKPENNRNSDPLDILIATILSQNTNDINSLKAYQNLKSKINNWEDLLKFSKAEIINEIKIAGLYNQKVNSIIELVKYFSEKYKNNYNLLYQKTNEELINEFTKINGIGVKTVACMLLFALKRNVCPVDTHVQRITKRLGIVNGNEPDKIFYEINNNLPENIGYSLHNNLIKHGRVCCKAKEPNCSQCPLNDICKFDSKITEIKRTNDKTLDTGIILLELV